MREITAKEQSFINTLFTYKETGRIEGLQVMRLLKVQLDCMFIRWEINPKHFISIAHTEELSKEEIEKKYFELCDIIYFIDELVENKFLTIQYTAPLSENNNRLLYDKDKYTYAENSKMFFYRNKDNNEKRIFLATPEQISYYNIDFANKLEKYANCIVYPLPLLKDFKDNNYQSLEQRRYQKQFRQTRCAIIISCISLVISVFGVIYESIFSKNITTDDAKMIEQSIRETKPVVIKITKDSIKVTSVDKQKTVSTNIK